MFGASAHTRPAIRAICGFLLTCVIGQGCVTRDSPTEASADFSTPDALVKAAGDDQTVTVGQVVPQPLRVVVFTPTGHKCNGCTVRWSLSPAGFVEGVITTRTDVTGIVDFRINSLAFAARYTVTAALDNGKSVDFALTAK